MSEAAIRLSVEKFENFQQYRRKKIDLIDRSRIDDLKQSKGFKDPEIPVLSGIHSLTVEPTSNERLEHAVAVFDHQHLDRVHLAKILPPWQILDWLGMRPPALLTKQHLGFTTLKGLGRVQP